MQIDDIDYKITQTVKQLAESCLDAGISIAVAESCTGGWLSKVLTDIAGSSRWFECGFVTYSNDAKMSMISVQQTTLESYGAVSKNTVSEMASGVLAHSNATLSVAISGIAGPDGGSVEKPVGLVWFAFASAFDQKVNVVTEKHLFKGSREQVRGQAVLQALSGFIQIIQLR
ncbi:Nicotinamide-nucleotide amidase [hydrothermal vent metagenome]|uniref:Nicotinamide-nucleotide amidase n=1 Tax=hydrothermal vent metagenome TaxID=652676 RepID=A0A3B1ANE4_9ZZZZ